MTGTALILIALAGAIRYAPHLLSRGLGVDHWFWKLYVRTYRSEGVFPPRIPQYLLDEAQWYPPLFPLVLARWPAIFSERDSRWASIAIDLARMALVLWVTARFGGSGFGVIVAGAVYALTPILVSYNVQLNPRGLGALFFDMLLVLVIAASSTSVPASWTWAAALLLGALVLLTHKMTTQLLVFTAVVAACVNVDWRPVVLLVGAFAAAVVLSGGFYLRVLQSHADIVAFWARNWPWLQADPVRESPIYGTVGYQTPTKFYQPGLKGMVRHVTYLFGFNPWAWCLPLAFVGKHHTVGMETTLVFWSALVIAFSLLTVVVPFLRRFGSGYFYLYNAAFPVAVVWGTTAAPTTSYVAAFACGAVVAVASIVAFYLRLRGRDDGVDDDFARMLGFIKQLPQGAVWCLPMQWYDLVAYETGQPVLYGGHGYGFRRLEDVFPRIKRPVREICRAYGVTYLVTKDGYLPDSFERSLDVQRTESFGPYRLMILSVPHQAETSPTMEMATAAHIPRIVESSS